MFWQEAEAVLCVCVPCFPAPCSCPPICSGPTFCLWLLASVTLTIFRLNSKFDQNFERSSLKYTEPITKFCSRHDSVRVQNFFVIGRVHFKPEHCKFWSNFEFDRNIVSGTGAWAHKGFMSSLSKSCDKNCCWYLTKDDQIRTQFCTCHDS